MSRLKFQGGDDVAKVPGGAKAGMADYRAYTVGLDGHFVGHQPLVCADDAEATDKARRLVDGLDIELWCGTRLVARLEASKSKIAPWSVLVSMTDAARVRVLHRRPPMAFPGDREFGSAPAWQGSPHVRIQVSFRYRAASLPEVPRTADASFKNRGRTIRIRIPDIRLPEVRPRSHHDHFQRPEGFQAARLAFRRTWSVAG
jgi:hypothetical protein